MHRCLTYIQVPVQINKCVCWFTDMCVLWGRSWMSSMFNSLGCSSFQFVMVLTKKLCLWCLELDHNRLWFTRHVILSIAIKYPKIWIAISWLITCWMFSNKDVIMPGSREYTCLMDLAALLCTVSSYCMCYWRCRSQTQLAWEYWSYQGYICLTFYIHLAFTKIPS